MTRPHLVRRAAVALAAGFAITAFVPAASATAQAANGSHLGQATASPAATQRFIRSYFINIQNCYRDGDAGIRDGLWDSYTCRSTGGPLGLPRRDLWVSP
jgi:hypothetical protein